MNLEFQASSTPDEARQLRLDVLKRTFLRAPPKYGAIAIDPRSLPAPARPESQALIKAESKESSGPKSNIGNVGGAVVPSVLPNTSQAISTTMRKQQSHSPWKLMRVISGHGGWVQSVTIDPTNEWFATGSSDTTIKIWDLASGKLKLTLTGHIMAVRALAVSPTMPYLFSASEDKTVKCWDLEYNKVVREYHGHLSGVYSLDLHPLLDVAVTGGRDSAVRVWDIRSRQAIYVLQGHNSAINSVKCRDLDPQIISGSQDSTIRLWDLAAGKSMATLTHHSKSVRALAAHPDENTFYSASHDAIKQWRLPPGDFMGNAVPGDLPIINTLAINSPQGVLFAGGDDGSLNFYDYASGNRFQKLQTTLMPGSLAAEASIMAATFDRTGLRLITGEGDKTIKIWKEVQ